MKSYLKYEEGKHYNINEVLKMVKEFKKLKVKTICFFPSSEADKNKSQDYITSINNSNQ